MSEQEEGARIVAKYGHRAHEIRDELREAFRVKDGYRAGQLCKEMWHHPDLLMLVVSLLLATPTSGPLATPEEMGMDPESARLKPEAWQVAANDQVEAAAEAHDFPTYARLATDAWLKAVVMDIRKYKADEGIWPDASYLLRGTMVAEPTALTAVAAECLYRLAMAEIGH